MEHIERIGPTPQFELGTSDASITTMRDFLAKARVARDFQDLKSDAQRLQSARRQGLVNGIADPDGDIQAVGNEVDLFVGRLQFDLDVRIEL